MTQKKQKSSRFSLFYEKHVLRYECAFHSKRQYFDVKIEYVDITHEEFEEKMSGFKSRLAGLFDESKTLEEEIKKQLVGLKYE